MQLVSHTHQSFDQLPVFTTTFNNDFREHSKQASETQAFSLNFCSYTLKQGNLSRSPDIQQALSPTVNAGRTSRRQNRRAHTHERDVEHGRRRAQCVHRCAHDVRVSARVYAQRVRVERNPCGHRSRP